MTEPTESVTFEVGARVEFACWELVQTWHPGTVTDTHHGGVKITPDEAVDAAAFRTYSAVRPLEEKVSE